jgi:8-oxo-dGTP diphosphatase
MTRGRPFAHSLSSESSQSWAPYEERASIGRMFRRQHLLARALILRSDSTESAVLLTQATGESHTFLPGGHVESGEGLLEALRRELREELGVDCRVVHYLGAVEHQWPDENPQHLEINHVFLTELTIRHAELVSRESHLRFSWSPVSALAQHYLFPIPLQRLIAAWVSGDHRTWWATTLPGADLDPEDRTP